MSRQEWITWSFSGFNTEEDAEDWLDKAEVWFKQSKPDWKDWAISTTIGGHPTVGRIKATFVAEYDPQQ